MNLVGVDLGGRTMGKTGIAVVNSRTREVQVFLDRELPGARDDHADADQVLLDFLLGCKPEKVALDAPLTLPAGVVERRPATGPVEYLFRSCDRTLGGLATLSSQLAPIAARGIALKRRLEARRIHVIEVYPRASLLRFGIEAGFLRGKRSYHRNVGAVRSIWRLLGVEATFKLTRGKVETADALDAVAAALTVAAPPEDVEWVGDKAEGQILVPVWGRRFWTP